MSDTVVPSSRGFFSVPPRVNRVHFLGVLSLYICLTPFLMVLTLSLPLGTFFFAVTLIAGIIYIIRVRIARLHDINRTGFWVLVNFIPIIGTVIDLIMFFWPGNKTENIYGAQPHRAAKRYWFYMLSAPVLLVCCALFY